MKTCPYCKGSKIMTFDSDNDWCHNCGKYFPAVKDKPLFPKAQSLCFDKLQTKTECECGGALFHVELLYSDTGYEDRYMEMSGILYECVACGYIHTAWRDGQ